MCYKSGAASSRPLPLAPARPRRATLRRCLRSRALRRRRAPPRVRVRDGVRRVVPAGMCRRALRAAMPTLGGFAWVWATELLKK